MPKTLLLVDSDLAEPVAVEMSDGDVLRVGDDLSFGKCRKATAEDLAEGLGLDADTLDVAADCCTAVHTDLRPLAGYARYEKQMDDAKKAVAPIAEAARLVRESQPATVVREEDGHAD